MKHTTIIFAALFLYINSTAQNSSEDLRRPIIYSKAIETVLTHVDSFDNVTIKFYSDNTITFVVDKNLYLETIVKANTVVPKSKLEPIKTTYQLKDGHTLLMYKSPVSLKNIAFEWIHNNYKINNKTITSENIRWVNKFNQ
jgi:hypothetical protein